MRANKIANVDDPAVTEARKRNMRAVKSKHTQPERVVRSLLHRLGYRFRLHRGDLPGSPDIVFSARRKIIEVRGCFWHSHRDPSCRKATIPATRSKWWKAKLLSNVERDLRNEAKLHAAGWAILVIWECELRDRRAVEERLRHFLG